MSPALLFHFLMLNMFQMLVHPSSGACDLCVELFHGLYCSCSMCVVLRCCLAGVVWYPYAGWSTATTPLQPNNNVTQHTSNKSNTTHEITQQISRKLLRMGVLTSKTCWELNNEIIKQVTSSWSLFRHGDIFTFTCGTARQPITLHKTLYFTWPYRFIASQLVWAGHSVVTPNGSDKNGISQVKYRPWGT